MAGGACQLFDELWKGDPVRHLVVRVLSYAKIILRSWLVSRIVRFQRLLKGKIIIKTNKPMKTLVSLRKKESQSEGRL